MLYLKMVSQDLFLLQISPFHSQAKWTGRSVVGQRGLQQKPSGVGLSTRPSLEWPPPREPCLPSSSGSPLCWSTGTRSCTIPQSPPRETRQSGWWCSGYSPSLQCHQHWTRETERGQMKKRNTRGWHTCTANATTLNIFVRGAIYTHVSVLSLSKEGPAEQNPHGFRSPSIHKITAGVLLCLPSHLIYFNY